MKPNKAAGGQGFLPAAKRAQDDLRDASGEDDLRVVAEGVNGADLVHGDEPSAALEWDKNLVSDGRHLALARPIQPQETSNGPPQALTRDRLDKEVEGIQLKRAGSPFLIVRKEDDIEGRRPSGEALDQSGGISVQIAEKEAEGIPVNLLKPRGDLRYFDGRMSE